METDKDKILYSEKRELPDYVQFKRGNLFLIILGYIFAVFAGINGIMGINHFLWVLFGDLPSNWIDRLVDVIQILCIYGLYKWGYTYAWGKVYTPADDGFIMYRHAKYDKFTRINGVCILFVGFISALLYGSTLNW